jgi:EmrB/QacA subfamily drug resistance transporter
MAQSEITRADVGLRSERGPVLGSIMLSVGLIAIDATILATAVPSIVNDLGGFTQFPWLFSIFLLTQAVSVPIYAKFSDMYGRKPIMLIGIALFVVASVLCGLAWSMPALIVFRALQGLGAGAVQPTSMTIIGDLYSVVERAKVQGYVASVWAMSSVVGPTLGGLFVDFVNWRWIFFINIPLGLLAAWMLQRHFHEDVTRTKHTIDYTGAVLLTLGSSLVIFALLEGGLLWPWWSVPSVTIIGTGVAALVAFAIVERRAAEPMLPGWIFRHRLINATNLVSVAVGVILIGLTSYVPLYVQGVLGTSALVAGFTLAGLTLGWPIAASLAGRLYLRLGFRNTALLGTVGAVLGGALLLLISPETTVWQIGVTCFVIGLGMGLIASPTLVAAQSAVEWENRGVVTGTTMFARSMGSALGIAVYGAVANAILAGRLAGSEATTSADIPPGDLHNALSQVFVGVALTALVLVVGVVLMPRGDRPTVDAER